VRYLRTPPDQGNDDGNRSGTGMIEEWFAFN